MGINMTHFYSKTTNGFYVEGIHKDMPNDVVAVTDAERKSALAGQEDGGEIRGDAQGKPSVFYAAQPTPAALATAARAKRDALLATSDWTQVADAPVDQAAWATYRQALRDVPAQAGFPEAIDWPVAPE